MSTSNTQTNKPAENQRHETQVKINKEIFSHNEGIGILLEPIIQGSEGVYMNYHPLTCSYGVRAKNLSPDVILVRKDDIIQHLQNMGYEYIIIATHQSAHGSHSHRIYPYTCENDFAKAMINGLTQQPKKQTITTPNLGAKIVGASWAKAPSVIKSSAKYTCQ